MYLQVKNDDVYGFEGFGIAPGVVAAIITGVSTIGSSILDLFSASKMKSGMEKSAYYQSQAIRYAADKQAQSTQYLADKAQVIITILVVGIVLYAIFRGSKKVVEKGK